MIAGKAKISVGVCCREQRRLHGSPGVGDSGEGEGAEALLG